MTFTNQKYKQDVPLPTQYQTPWLHSRFSLLLMDRILNTSWRQANQFADR